MLKGIIFDLDGTVIDSKDDLILSITDSIREMGEEVPDLENLLALMGASFKTVWNTLFPEKPQRAEEFCSLCINHHTQDRIVNTKLYPGVSEVLDGLKLKLAIATARESYRANRILKTLGVRQYFDCVCGSEDLPDKPNPAVVLKAIQGLRLQPEECVMVGDTYRDIVAGEAAGTRTIGVEFDPGSSLSWIKPDAAIRNFKQLPEILEELNTTD